MLVGSYQFVAVYLFAWFQNSLSFLMFRIPGVIWPIWPVNLRRNLHLRSEEGSAKHGFIWGLPSSSSDDCLTHIAFKHLCSLFTNNHISWVQRILKTRRHILGPSDPYPISKPQRHLRADRQLKSVLWYFPSASKGAFLNSNPVVSEGYFNNVYVREKG